MVTRTNRLLSFLDEADVDYEVIPHRLDFTAQRAAADTHTPGRAFAKTVMVEMDGAFAMAVLPAHHRVHFARIREMIGVDAVLASEDKVAELFPDCEVGAEPPFGNLYGLPVYVSPDIAEQRDITFNAGTHHEAIRMRYADYERLVRPKVLDLSWHR